MKKLIYLLFVTTLFISCEKDSNDELTNDQNLTTIYLKANGSENFIQKNSSNCFISGPTIVQPNTFETYIIRNTQVYGGTLRLDTDDSSIWRFAGVTAPDASGNITARIFFGSNFKCGSFNVNLSNDFGETCETSIDISTGDNCTCITTPPAPEAIDSRFGTPVPPGYVQGNLGGNSICTNTIDNTLSVPLDSCSSYSWSITPSGTHLATILPSRNEAVVIIKQPGEYVVRLVTSNNAGQRTEQYVLFAENCNGGGIGGF
ncbi:MULTISPECIES: hypothetical protein [Aquimarina]|uniref:PKD domain-containing protein n=1 Tax=Aquimarina algiphila TaxID=2047982 RepID=A0A554VBP6_9FLAO|nr:MULTISPECIES: hypothetical protein [Aquimarina]TSE04008.1 hypothetical protein FOF46_27865 [Aquimarina algiphila]